MKTKLVSEFKKTSCHIRHDLTDAETCFLAFEICDRIATGEYLTAIAREEGMPHPNTFRNWAEEFPVIDAAYKGAQWCRIECLREEIDTIIDTPPATCKDARGNTRIDPAGIALMKLRLENKRWMHCVLNNNLASRDYRARDLKGYPARQMSAEIPPPVSMHKKSDDPAEPPQPEPIPPSPAPDKVSDATAPGPKPQTMESKPLPQAHPASKNPPPAYAQPGGTRQPAAGSPEGDSGGSRQNPAGGSQENLPPPVAEPSANQPPAPIPNPGPKPQNYTSGRSLRFRQ